MSLNLVSLFAGVGGFDLAAERAGINPAVAVEIDEKARNVLAYKFPSTTIYNDVRTVTGEQLRGLGLDPRTTIVTGGFPCQDLSIAGKQAGLTGGERSSLFFEIVRILREFRPAWFVLENVQGLLSSNNGRDLGIVIGQLAEVGYVFGWRVLDSQHFGVAQRRKRVFIVGSSGTNASRVSEVLFERESSAGDFTQGQPVGAGPAPRTTGSVGSNSGQLAPYVKSRRAQSVTDYETWKDGQVSPTLNLMDNASESRATVLAVSNSVFSLTRNENIRVFNDQAPTVATWYGTGGNNVPLMHQSYNNPPTVVRRLTPTECERLQGFPDEWTRYGLKAGEITQQADGARYRQLGNAVTVNVAEWLFNRLVKVDEANA